MYRIMQPVRWMVQNWTTIFGVSFGTGLVAAAFYALTSFSPEDDRVFYTLTGPLSYAWVPLVFALSGMTVSAFLYFAKSGRPLRFTFMLVGVVFMSICMLAALGPALGQTFFNRHMDSTRMNGHVYHISLTSELMYPQTWTLYECDTLGIRCDRIHSDTYYQDFVMHGVNPSMRLAIESDELTIFLNEGRVYTYPPDANQSLFRRK